MFWQRLAILSEMHPLRIVAVICDMLWKTIISVAVFILIGWYTFNPFIAQLQRAASPPILTAGIMIECEDGLDKRTRYVQSNGEAVEIQNCPALATEEGATVTTWLVTTETPPNSWMLEAVPNELTYLGVMPHPTEWKVRSPTRSTVFRLAYPYPSK